MEAVAQLCAAVDHGGFGVERVDVETIVWQHDRAAVAMEPVLEARGPEPDRAFGAEAAIHVQRAGDFDIAGGERVAVVEREARAPQIEHAANGGAEHGNAAERDETRAQVHIAGDARVAEVEREDADAVGRGQGAIAGELGPARFERAFDHRALKIDAADAVFHQRLQLAHRERTVEPRVMAGEARDRGAIERETRQARMRKVDRFGNVAVQQFERGQARAASASAIGKIEHAFDARAAHPHARHAHGPIGRQPNEQTSQEAGADQRLDAVRPDHWREIGDLAVPRAFDDVTLDRREIVGVKCHACACPRAAPSGANNHSALCGRRPLRVAL